MLHPLFWLDTSAQSALVPYISTSYHFAFLNEPPLTSSRAICLTESLGQNNSWLRHKGNHSVLFILSHSLLRSRIGLFLFYSVQIGESFGVNLQEAAWILENTN